MAVLHGYGLTLTAGQQVCSAPSKMYSGESSAGACVGSLRYRMKCFSFMRTE